MNRYRDVRVAAAADGLARAGGEAAVLQISAPALADCPEAVRVPEGGWVRWLNLEAPPHVVASSRGRVPRRHARADAALHIPIPAPPPVS